MILNVAAIDDPAKLEEIGKLIAALEWRDGRETAGNVAKAVKRNEQAVMKSTSGQALRQALLPHIIENPVIRAAARPRRFSHLLVSRTRDGGHYGPHVDNALMGQGEARMRSDVSFTLFLSNPEDYEGGELVVHAAGGTQTVKARAGHIVLYPSSSIHEVKPVTAGTRIVCVGWIESMIADPVQRELLFDLENTRASLRQTLPPQSRELLTLDKTIANLLRMWARA